MIGPNSKTVVLSQPLQGVETGGTRGVVMTVETEDFDRGAFSSRGSLTYGLRNQPSRAMQL